MILLRKFLTFPHKRDFYQITYGKYKFVIDEYEYIWSINFGKKIWKTFRNYEVRSYRPFATLRVGAYMIILYQTCFILMNTLDYTEYYSISLYDEVGNVSYKKFIDEYARALRHA